MRVVQKVKGRKNPRFCNEPTIIEGDFFSLLFYLLNFLIVVKIFNFIKQNIVFLVLKTDNIFGISIVVVDKL